jgi:hypothetical protein
VDGDGILRGNRFEGEWKPEYRWYPFPNAVFTPGTDVAAVSRNPNRMELWVLGKDDGVIRGNWFDEGGWQSGWYELGDAQFNQGTDLAAVSRSHVGGAITGLNAALPVSPEMMELWTVGQDSVIRGRWFAGPWRWWYSLSWSFEG